MQQTKGRGNALSMRPQPQTGTTAMLGFGGGLGGGGSINNITNLVGSNIGANTGVAEINADVDADQPVTIPGSPDTDTILALIPHLLNLSHTSPLKPFDSAEPLGITPKT